MLCCNKSEASQSHSAYPIQLIPRPNVLFSIHCIFIYIYITVIYYISFMVESCQDTPYLLIWHFIEVPVVASTLEIYWFSACAWSNLVNWRTYTFPLNLTKKSIFQKLPTSSYQNGKTCKQHILKKNNQPTQTQLFHGWPPFRRLSPVAVPTPWFSAAQRRFANMLPGLRSLGSSVGTCWKRGGGGEKTATSPIWTSSEERLRKHIFEMEVASDFQVEHPSRA